VLPKAENVILTGDMDALQLVDEQTKVYTMRRGMKDTVLYGIKETKEKYDGLKPEQLTDYRALRGDPSDNIPGVTGIGEKTAIELLKQFKTLENLYKEIEEENKSISKIKPGVLEKLKQYKDQAFISQKLAEIDCNVDIDFKLKDCGFDYNKEKVIKIFNEFEFYALLKRLPGAIVVEEKKTTKPAELQQGLFGGEKVENTIQQDIAELKKQRVLSKEIADLETDLISVIEQMQKNGIKVEIKSLNELSKKLTQEINSLTKKIFKISGKQFNLNSPKQLSEILFNELQISTKGIRKTPGGAISTNAKELKKLKKDNPIADLILQYREVFKLKSGFADALPRMINPKTGRIHPHFHQLGTETGRMSCSDPNLQNVPIKGELGNEIRKCFVPKPGFVFVSADYSQMELRVAAVLANDEKMLGFFKENKDIHTMTAKEVFKVKASDVTKKQRNIAKSLNFGVLYGMGAYGFAERTGVSNDEARAFIEQYFLDFKGITNFVEKSIADTRKNGFSETMFGRKRFLPEINSRDPRLRAQAERMARNFPAQGTSADIMKMAMVALDKKKVFNNDCRMLLQIHDELLFEVKKEKAEKVSKEIKKIMQGVVKLEVPMIVDIAIGKSWGDLK
ncbi:MAG: hypothetical protein HQ539_01800, partial [Parcubacteria group bacterium]|nr:hypothetical protein [Parcubacteria group bacterium]